MNDPFNLLVIDPHLKSPWGHYFTYNLSVLEEGRRRKHKVLIFGHRDMQPSVREALDAIPLFPDVPLNSTGRRIIPLRKLSSFHFTVRATASFITDLRKAESYGAGTRRLLFFPSCGWLGDAMSVALGLLSAPVDPNSSYVLLFRIEPPAEAHRRAWVRLAFRLIERAARRHTVRLVTDSDRLARSYESVTSLPFQVVPIPHMPPAVASGLPDEGQRAQTASPHLVYLGGGRQDQGIHLLVDALIQLRPKLAKGAFSSTVQLNLYDPAAAESCRRLENAALENVRIVRGTLSREEYEEILGTADLVLIPYLAEVYNSRTSGVLTEALSLGKPAVVPRDTWMSDQVSRGAGVLFDGETSEDLVRAIETAVQRIDELKARATELQPEWNGFHNPDSFYRQLVYGPSERPSCESAD